MAQEPDIIPGNGKQILEALTILQRYEGKRAKLDVSMNATDEIIIYLNAASAKLQPRLREEDVAAVEALGFIAGEDANGYRLFTLR